MAHLHAGKPDMRNLHGTMIDLTYWEFRLLRSFFGYPSIQPSSKLRGGGDLIPDTDEARHRANFQQKCMDCRWNRRQGCQIVSVDLFGISTHLKEENTSI